MDAKEKESLDINFEWVTPGMEYLASKTMNFAQLLAVDGIETSLFFDRDGMPALNILEESEDGSVMAGIFQFLPQSEDMEAFDLVAFDTLPFEADRLTKLEACAAFTEGTFYASAVPAQEGILMTSALREEAEPASDELLIWFAQEFVSERERLGTILALARNE